MSTPTTTTIPVTPGSGINLDAVQVTVASTAVARETVVMADPVSPTALAADKDAATQAPSVDGSLVVQINPNQPAFTQQQIPVFSQEVLDGDVVELLQHILLELRGVRLACAALACEGKRNNEADFDPDKFTQTGMTIDNGSIIN